MKKKKEDKTEDKSECEAIKEAIDAASKQMKEDGNSEDKSCHSSSKAKEEEENNEASPNCNDKGKNREGELVSTVQMLQAEFENYRKRIERDRAQFCEFAGKAFVEKLIPAMDNFELALKNKDDENKEEFVMAIMMVYSQIWEVLKAEGLERIEAKGKMFDPELHSPLLQEESDEKPNTVLEELKPGYMFKCKVIRHTMVKLAKEREVKEKKQQQG
jgi:molecular chaperone GrpE